MSVETAERTIECPRCAGTGRYYSYGVCYRCHGSGRTRYVAPRRSEPAAHGPDYSLMGRTLSLEVRTALLEIIEGDTPLATGAAHWLSQADEKNAREWLDRCAPWWRG